VRPKCRHGAYSPIANHVSPGLPQTLPFGWVPPSKGNDTNAPRSVCAVERARKRKGRTPFRNHAEGDVLVRVRMQRHEDSETLCFASTRRLWKVEPFSTCNADLLKHAHEPSRSPHQVNSWYRALGCSSCRHVYVRPIESCRNDIRCKAFENRYAISERRVFQNESCPNTRFQYGVSMIFKENVAGLQKNGAKSSGHEFPAIR